MPKVFIDNIEVTNILDIGEISDQLSPNGSSFNITFLGYPTTNKLGRVRVEVYDDDGNLAAVGNGIPTITVGKRVKTVYQVGDLTQHLTRKKLRLQLNGTVQSCLELLLSLSCSDMYFNFIRFRTASDTPNIIISQYIDFQFFKDAITQVLTSSGRNLQYKIPIDEPCIEIIEHGYNAIAPISEINIENLLDCNRKGIKDISYSLLEPIASVIRVYGRNGRNARNGVTSINPDILRYRAQDGRDNYPTLETADEVLLIKVTTPEPPPSGCNVTEVITGDNYSEADQLFTYRLFLPTVSTDAVSLVKTADIVDIKQSSNVSFYITGTIDTVEGNLNITFEGTEIYNQPLNAAMLNNTIVLPLSAYEGQSGQVVATLTLDAQPTTTTNYALFLEVDCCAIVTYAGTGIAGFNFDGATRLNTDLNNPTKVHVDTDGIIYFADTANYRLRIIALDGIITTIGGNGNAAITPPVDGRVATDQDFGNIYDFVISGTNLYCTLFDWNQVAKIDLLTGLYYLIDDDFIPGDGLFGITADSDGNIYYAVGDGSVVYKLENETTRSIYAGIYTSPGFSGDGGLATSAELDRPHDLTMDSNNNLYISTANGARNVIRKVNSSDGIINTICGNGSLSEFGIDATQYRSQEGSAIAMSIDPTTNDFYFKADKIIAKIDGTTNLVSRFASLSDASAIGFSGDYGSPITAKFDFNGTFFGGLHVVNSTNIYIADENNNRIRKILCGDITYGTCPSTDTITTNPSSSISNGTFGSITTNPNPGYSAGGSGTPNTVDLSISFDIDLTNPNFISHTVNLHAVLNNTIAATATNSLTIISELKINGTTLYSVNNNESVTGSGTMVREFDAVLDLSAYIGTVLTLEITANLNATTAAGTTFSSSFSGTLSC